MLLFAKLSCSQQSKDKKQGNLLLATCCLLLALCSCSFDYYEFESTGEVLPDLVMENVEYIRVKSAEPQAKFNAERAERYEEQNLMILENIAFEQFGSTIDEVNAQGFAEIAVIEIDSGNITMENSVKIEIESEDIIIETEFLEWQDESKILSAGDEEVVIFMSNGTNFNGTGFSADARNRTWEFAGSVEGEYIFEEDEEEKSEDSEGSEGNEEIEDNEYV